MPYKSIAEDLGISLRCAHKWGQVMKRGGLLEPPMGRPRRGVLGSFPPRIAEAVDRMRPGVGGWGSRTLRVELEHDPALCGLRLPSARSIDNYLKAQKRVRSNWHAEPLPSEPVVQSRGPHDVWQLDAEGNKRVKGVGVVSMVNIGDTFSKVYVSTYPVKLAGNFNHLTKEHYQFALRLGFVEFGRCNHLQLDHESVFYDNTSTSPYPTPLHLWLLGLGVPATFTPKAKPFKQGGVERKHRTMHQQVCEGREFAGHAELFAMCQQRRKRLNNDIPCRTLGNRPPLKVFPEAARPAKPYLPGNEEDYFDTKRIYDYLQDGQWSRTVVSNKSFSLGNQQYYLNHAVPNSTIQIKFDPSTKMFDCRDANGKLVGNLKPKGISFKELCGDLEGFICWFKENSHLFHSTD
jgi:hypothetical protein